MELLVEFVLEMVLAVFWPRSWVGLAIAVFVLGTVGLVIFVAVT